MKSIGIIFVVLLLDLLAFTVILPLFPSIIDHYDNQGADDQEGVDEQGADASLAWIHRVLESMRSALQMPDRRRYNNVLVGGLLGSLLSFLQFVSSPIVGSLSDTFGRKKLLVFTMFEIDYLYEAFITRFTYMAFILVMLFLTAERLLRLSLNLQYPVYWSLRRTQVAFVVIWVVSLIFGGLFTGVKSLTETLGTTLSYVIWWKATTFTLFIVSRVVGGLTKGSVLLCTTMVADVTTKQNRGKGMAFIGLAFSLAFITGPLIGAYFATQHQRHVVGAFETPAQVSIMFQLLSLFVASLFLEETLPQTKMHSIGMGFQKMVKLLSPVSLFSFSTHKDQDGSLLRRLAIVNFLYLLFFSGLEFTLTFLTHERFQFTSMQQGKLFFFAGFIMMIVQGGYVRRMKHGNELKVVKQGILVIIPAMLIISVASTVLYTYIALTLYSFGAGTVVPLLTAIFTQNCTENESGENVGKFRSVGAFSRAIAPAFTCFVYWSLGSQICYMIGGALFILPLLLLFSCNNTKDKVK